MPCNSPNRVFYTGGINPDTGKRKTLFTSRHVDYIYREIGSDRWNLGHNLTDDYPKLDPVRYQMITEHDDIPCGQCIGCRLDYSREWSTRIMVEKRDYPDDECWFVTLTYDDDHLHNAELEVTDYDLETGEILGTKHKSEFFTLSKRDHQLFMKNLRYQYSQKSDKKLRFFMAGEYGSKSMRPHYHYIIFGLKLDDLEVYKITGAGYVLYNSKFITDIWNKGHVVIGRVTSESSAYVARYCIKKRKITTKETYEKLGILPEFVCMSRKPGIGSNGFEVNYKKYYENDEIIMPTNKGAYSARPPHFFDTLLERIDPDLKEEIVQNRKKKAMEKDDFLADFLPYLDKEVILETRERNLLKNIAVLEERDL